jgi:hypothetical protein
MKKRLLIMGLGTLVSAGQLMASPILDFEALAHAGPTWVTYSSVSEDGFTFSSPVGINITGSNGIPTQNDGYKGSATAWVSGGNTISLVKDDSNSFDLESIDLARFSDAYSGSTTVAIIGYNAGGTQVASQSFTLPGAGDESLQTYTLDSTFSGIYKASWLQTPDYFQFDNVIVPEPTSIAMIGLVSGGAVFIRRRLVR